jgi:hypothetical protein
LEVQVVAHVESVVVVQGQICLDTTCCHGGM